MPSTVTTEAITGNSTAALSVRAGRAAPAVLLALALISALYLLQLASPLRLNFDVVVLLSMAREAAQGGGYTYHGLPTQYPPGYPFLVRVLDSAGIAASWSLIGMNLIFLGAGLFALHHVQRRVLGLTRNISLVLCGMTLLSYVFVKHSTLPMSDIPFFGVCACALAAMAECKGNVRRFRLMLPLAALATGAAILIRLAGIALLPPLLWVVAARFSRHGRPVSKRRKAAVAVGIAIMLAGVLWGVTTTRYFRETAETLANKSAASNYLFAIASSARMHLLEGGEVFVNVPAAKAPEKVRRYYPAAGILMAGLPLYSIWISRRKLGPVQLFATSYFLLLFGYVGYDARYWMPVLPFAFALGASALRRPGVPGWLRAAGPVYAAWLLITGLTGLAYSTRISLSGDRFGDLFGDGNLTNTYRAAFGLPAAEGLPGVNREGFDLLRKYGSRK